MKFHICLWKSLTTYHAILRSLYHRTVYLLSSSIHILTKNEFWIFHDFFSGYAIGPPYCVPTEFYNVFLFTTWWHENLIMVHEITNLRLLLSFSKIVSAKKLQDHCSKLISTHWVRIQFLILSKVLLLRSCGALGSYYET